MKRSAFTVLGVVLLVIGLFLLKASLFVVDETEQAVVVRLGRPVHVIAGDRTDEAWKKIEAAVAEEEKRSNTTIRLSRGAGLYFKTPFVDDVKILDDRILEYDSKPAEIVTRDKKSLNVDNYARWQIENPLLFLLRVKDEIKAQSRLDDIVFSDLRQFLSKSDMWEIVRTTNGVLEQDPELKSIREGYGRDEILQRVTTLANSKLGEHGIRVLDVRIKRADLLPRNERAVFERMTAERKRKSDQNRAEGKKEQQKIQAEADKQVQIILAEADRDAQILLGEGEATAAATYAAAYEAHREFYSFIRGLEALEKSVDENTRLVIGTDSPVFRYLKEMTTK
ncbi:MAG: protease modulator HflC [Planctomycetota bacterium]